MDDASHDVKQASTAAFFSAGFGIIVIISAMLSSANEEFALYNDPANFIDVALVIGCGIGLRYFSRTAAITLFTYFILAKTYILITHGRPSGFLVGLIFVYFYWKGIRGSFAYHRLRREADPSYRPNLMWFYFLGIPVIVIVLSLIGIGLLVESGAVVPTSVVEGSELSQSHSTQLVDEGIISPDEKILLFYSTGLTSILDEGNLLTDKRIISYERFGEKLSVYAANYDDVSDVSVIEQGDYFNDTIVEILTNDDEEFLLVLSTDEEGDKKFINEIKSRIRPRSGEPAQPR